MNVRHLLQGVNCECKTSSRSVNYKCDTSSWRVHCAEEFLGTQLQWYIPVMSALRKHEARGLL